MGITRTTFCAQRVGQRPGGPGALVAPGPSEVNARSVTVRRVLIWIALYSIPLAAAARAQIDPDIWWHLRTGGWIVEHGTVPSTDPFSSFGEGRPWVAYSWLFELLVYTLYTWLGLHGIILFRVLLALVIVAAVHLLVARRERRFLPATALV